MSGRLAVLEIVSTQVGYLLPSVIHSGSLAYHKLNIVIIEQTSIVIHLRQYN